MHARRIFTSLLITVNYCLSPHAATLPDHRATVWHQKSIHRDEGVPVSPSLFAWQTLVRLDSSSRNAQKEAISISTVQKRIPLSNNLDIFRQFPLVSRSHSKVFQGRRKFTQGAAALLFTKSKILPRSSSTFHCNLLASHSTKSKIPVSSLTLMFPHNFHQLLRTNL